MSALLYLAAGLMLVLAAAHSVLGERYILIRLFRRTDLPKVLGSADFTRHTLRFVWHVTTLMMSAFAVLLVLLGQGRLTPASAALTIGYGTIVAALMALVITRAKHLSWVVLLVIGAIALAFGAA